MLNTISAAIGNTWSLPFENPFIIWFQSLGGTNGYFHYFLYHLMNFISMFGEEMILVGIVGLLYWGTVSYTHLTLPTNNAQCRCRWAPED